MEFNWLIHYEYKFYSDKDHYEIRKDSKIIQSRESYMSQYEFRKEIDKIDIELYSKNRNAGHVIPICISKLF